MKDLRDEIAAIIGLKKFRSDDQFIDAEYFKFELSSDRVIYSALRKNDTTRDDDENSKLIGIPILELNQGGFEILPGCLQFINPDSPKIVLNSNLIDKISKGKTVKIKKNNRTYLVYDREKRLFALGVVKDNELTPLTDLGWYLRNDHFFENLL